MKVVLGMKGVTQVVPDYGMLKAALVAAQAATPTSRANGPRETPAAPHAALHAIFSSDTDVGSPAADLGHRFNIDASKTEDGA